MQNGQRMNIISFLEENDISVTKFLDWLNNNAEAEQNVLMIEFLESVDYHPFDGHTREYDSHISTYHQTHHSLDHAYDDAHDVTPYAYHEHAVYHAVPRDHYYNPDHEEGHQRDHHEYNNAEPKEDSVVTSHHVRREATPFEHHHGAYTQPHDVDHELH